MFLSSIALVFLLRFFLLVDSTLVWEDVPLSKLGQLTNCLSQRFDMPYHSFTPKFLYTVNAQNGQMLVIYKHCNVYTGAAHCFAALVVTDTSCYATRCGELRHFDTTEEITNSEVRAKNDAEMYLYFFPYICQEDWKAIQDIERDTKEKLLRSKHQFKWLWQVLDNHFVAICVRHNKNSEFAFAIGTMRNTEFFFGQLSKFGKLHEIESRVAEVLTDVDPFLDPKWYSQDSLKETFGDSCFQKLESFADLVANQCSLDNEDKQTEKKVNPILIKIKPVSSKFDKVAAIYKTDCRSSPNHVMVIVLTTNSENMLTLYKPISYQKAKDADGCNRLLKEHYALSFSPEILANWSWPWENKSITERFSQSLAQIRSKVLFEIGAKEEIHLQKIKKTTPSGIQAHSAAYGFKGNFFIVILDGSNIVVYVGGLQFPENIEKEEAEVIKRLYPVPGSDAIAEELEPHIGTIFELIKNGVVEVGKSWNAHNVQCTDKKSWLADYSTFPIPTQPRNAKHRHLWYLLVCQAPGVLPKQVEDKKSISSIFLNIFQKQPIVGKGTRLLVKQFCVIATIGDGVVREIITPTQNGVLPIFETLEDLHGFRQRLFRVAHRDALLRSTLSPT